MWLDTLLVKTKMRHLPFIDRWFTQGCNSNLNLQIGITYRLISMRIFVEFFLSV